MFCLRDSEIILVSYFLTLFSSTKSSNCGVLEQNTNFNGYDIAKGFSVLNFEECCGLCLKNRDSGCRFYTFNPEALCTPTSTQKGFTIYVCSRLKKFAKRAESTITSKFLF